MADSEWAARSILLMATETSKQGRVLTARNAGVRALIWREYDATPTPFQVVTTDGVEIRGVHFNRDFPTLLVYCHGFSSGKNVVFIKHLVETFAADVDVIVFDFRGHGESGGATTFGDKELLDVDAVLDYAKRFGYHRIVIMGSSMGGAIAIRYAADSPKVDAVITMGAFAHKRFSNMAMAGMGLLQWSVSRDVIKRASPTRIERAVPPYNPRDYVGKIAPRPLLLLHGEKDSLIPLSHAQQLYANAGEPKTLYVIPRGGHDLENMNGKTLKYIMDWVNETQGGVTHV